MMRRTMIAAACSAFALTACGSVSDSIDFHAPATYVSKAAIGPFMEVWMTPDSRSALIVMQFPGEVDLNKAMDSADVKNARNVKRQQITICGNQPAMLAQMTGTVGSTVKIGIGEGATKTDNSNIELVVTRAAGHSYFGMYAWPINSPPDAASEAAVRGLCPKK